MAAPTGFTGRCIYWVFSPDPCHRTFPPQRWTLFWLEEDFAWPLDAVLVVAAAVSFYDPVAARPWAVRGVAVGAVVAAVLLLPLV